LGWKRKAPSRRRSAGSASSILRQHARRRERLAALGTGQRDAGVRQAAVARLAFDGIA